VRAPLIAVIDYGMGNLHSVTKALAAAGGGMDAKPSSARQDVAHQEGGNVITVTTAAELARADAIVLPGVGHFGEASRRLEERGLSEPLRAWAREGRPFLGICLGLQVLFESSEESPGVKGLGIFPGTVKRFPREVNGQKLIVPAIGWNAVTPVSSDAATILGSSRDERYYFVHSYFVAPAENALIAATAEYGPAYCAAVARPPLFATQFHPEKSGAAGLELLKRFLAHVAARVPAASEPGRIAV
jgi:imidazole glycerol phosphate synthase glutamine amidotransferase subunit